MSGFSGNYLDALAHPVIVNPVEAIARGNQAAAAVWQNRLYQAHQAAGEAFQNSLNPDGTPNQAAFNRNLVAAGPNAALAALDSSQKGVTLDTDTFALHSKRLAGVSASMMSLIADNPHGVPQDQVNAAIDAQLKQGNLTPEQAAAARSTFGPDPVANTRQLIQNNGRVIAAQTQLENARPQTSLENTGTAIVPVAKVPLSSTSQPPGSATQGAGGVSTGPTPAQLAQPFTYKDDNGREVTEPYGDFLKRRGFQLPGGGGAQPGSSTATPPVPSPIPGGGVYRPPAAPAAPAGGGAAPPPPPAAPGAATPPAAAPAPALPPPAPTGPAVGRTEQLQADQKQFAADQTALPQRQTQNQNLQHAYDALKLITTGGTSAEGISRMRSFLAGVGALPAGQLSNEAVYEIFRKYTERTIADAGNAGGTDLSRKVAEASNAGVSLVSPANLAVLRNDIGKVRQQMAATMTAPDKEAGAGYGKHAADTASNTDYRGFNWDAYSPSEQAEIKRSAEKAGQKAQDALARAIGMGRTFWPEGGATSVVPHG